MERRLYIPGRYAREMRERNEEMRRGNIPPAVDIYDTTQRADALKLNQDVKASMGDKIILPWGTFRKKVEKRADRRGVYRDAFELWSQDHLDLQYGKHYFDGKEDELKEKIQERDKPENFVIVHYPWLNAFSKIARQPEFTDTTQSREYGITSDEAKQGLQTDNFLFIGGGVGGRMAVSFAGAGAAHAKVVDKSPIAPHRGSRVTGPFIPQMGENQATYYVKQMLELNPYGDYEAIPQYIGDAATEPGVVDMGELLDWSTVTMQEIDQLKKKGLIHLKAKEKGVVCMQFTDAGRRVIVMVDDPNFEQIPFNGRYTAEVDEKIQKFNPKDTDAFLDNAVTIFMGPQATEFRKILEKSRERYSHLPQSGRAAGKVGAEAVNVYCDLKEGKITGPLEFLIP